MFKPIFLLFFNSFSKLFSKWIITIFFIDVLKSKMSITKIVLLIWWSGLNNCDHARKKFLVNHTLALIGIHNVCEYNLQFHWETLFLFPSRRSSNVSWTGKCLRKPTPGNSPIMRFIIFFFSFYFFKAFQLAFRPTPLFLLIEGENEGEGVNVRFFIWVIEYYTTGKDLPKRKML